MTGIGTFLTAWGDGLSAGLPTGLRSQLGLGRAIAVAEPADEGYRLSLARGGDLQPRGVVAAAELSGQLASLAGSMALSVPEEDRVSATVTVPGTARRSLAQLLDGEVERLTPFKRDEVRIAYEIESEEQGRIQVRLHAAPRARLDELVRAFETSAGRPPDLVLAGPGQFTGAGAVDFSGHAVEAKSSARAFWPVLVFLLAWLAVLSPLPKPVLEAERLATETERLGSAVDAVQEMRAEIDRLRALGDALEAELSRNPDVAALLETVTVALPDDAWLTGFTVSRQGIVLEGYARDATGLLPRLEGIDGIADPSFKAPVTRDAATGQERFRIGAALKGAGG